MLIYCRDIASSNLSNIYNNSKDHKYPTSLKGADAIPHKQDEKILLKNYRPVSLIPIVSKHIRQKHV